MTSADLPLEVHVPQIGNLWQRGMYRGDKSFAWNGFI